MTEQHPITPPPELVRKWQSEWHSSLKITLFKWLTDKAAQWGADQELEACCRWVDKWIEEYADCGDSLREARRLQPPSLKEQALETLQRLSKNEFPCSFQEDADWDTIRRALEALPDA